MRGGKQQRQLEVNDADAKRHLQHQRGEHREPRSSPQRRRSEEHTSELQSLMRISYAVFCLKKKLPQTVHLLTTSRLFCTDSINKLREEYAAADPTRHH